MTQPLLRTPPFPGARREDAAVSRPDPAALPLSGDEAEAVAALIRAARVGGTYWAPPISNENGRLIVLRPRDRAAAARMLADAARLGTSRIVACGPAARHLPGVERHEGKRDPWSVLRPGTILFADADDEWATIAAIAGAERRGEGEVDLRRALGGVRYRDPFNGGAADAGETIARLAFWRALIDANRPLAVAAGMAWWKRDHIQRILWAGRERQLAFVDDPARAVAAARQAGGAIALWPAKAPGFSSPAAAAGVPLVRIEDGFVRSVGLGVDLHPPLSIVVDRSGIYYDPNGPSDLETILATADFPPALLARAAAIRATIVAGGISKYATEAPARPPTLRSRRTVLVAGQVEDDASVRTGGGAIQGNLDLLIRARAAEPDACLLFKPHPDVDAGHRRGRVADAVLLAHADKIVRGEGMAGLLGRVDAVHVLTSLTGFEALLRGLEVVVHGQPFFAGWGLTRDLATMPQRRGRVLTLDQLVAGTLILYPRYLDPVTGLPCPPEILLERLAGGWRPGWNPVTALRSLQGRLARALGTWTSGPKAGAP